MFVEYLNCFGCLSVSLFVNISLSTPFSLSLSLAIQWWLCFTKRRFMDKSLSGPGQ